MAATPPLASDEEFTDAVEMLPLDANLSSDQLINNGLSSRPTDAVKTPNVRVVPDGLPSSLPLEAYSDADTLKLDDSESPPGDGRTTTKSTPNGSRTRDYPPGLSPQSSQEAEKLLLPSTPSPVSTVATTKVELEPQFRTYKMRWYILAVASLLNFANTISWIAYAPVANYTDMFYVPHAANYLSMTFLVAAIPVAFVAMWAAGKYGVRVAILYAAVANGVGAIIRMSSSFTIFPAGTRFIIVLVGQCFAATAYPFIMFLPTKVAASWFPDNQRALASTIGTMSNPLGVLLAGLVSPHLAHHAGEIININIFTLVPSVLVCFMAVLGVRRSTPRIPPTRSAAQKSLSFGVGLVRLAKSRTYWLLFFWLGCGIGMFNCLYTVMQQILCAKGYSNTFSGLCASMMIVGGIFGSTACSVIVDRTRRFEEVTKIGFSFAVLMGIAYAELAMHPNLQGPIVVVCFLFGFCGIGAYPIGMELSAECTHPVAPTSSAGMITLMGQVQGVLFILMMQSLGSPARPADLAIETCSGANDVIAVASLLPLPVGEPTTGVPSELTTTLSPPEMGASNAVASDMTVPLLVFCGTAAVLVSIFVACFRPTYRRVALEKKFKEQQLAEEQKITNAVVEDGKQRHQHQHEQPSAEGGSTTLRL